MRLLEYPFAVLFLVLFVAFLWAGQLRSEDETEARTRASLALAKAARERAKAAPSPVAATKEQSDQSKLEEAGREARKRSVPVVCWVAMRADDSPEIKRSFGDVVHVELLSNEGSSKPRVLFVRPDKMTYVAYCSEGGLRADTAKKMWVEYRERMGLPASRSPAPQQIGYTRPVIVPSFVSGPDCST